MKDVQIELSDKYRFEFILVGSGNWGTMVKDEDGHYDLDYQIRLTHNSPVIGNNGFRNSTQVNKDFFEALRKHKKGKETFEDSTTAITLTNKDEKPYHIDFVIIDNTRYPPLIIRRNMKKGSPADEKTWNELPKMHWAFDYFKSLHHDYKKYIIEEMVIPAKQKEKAKKEGNSTKRSSTEIFVNEVNRFAQKYS